MTSGIAAISTDEALQRLTSADAPFATVITEIDGVPTRVYRSAPTDVRALFLDCTRWGDRVYVYFEDEALTYQELGRDVPALANALHRQFGIGKGDRIAICMRNYPEWAVAFWSILLLGAIVVPVNSWGTAAEIGYVLNHSGAKIVFADGERLERVGSIAASTVLDAIIAVRADGVGSELVRRYEDLIAASEEDVLAPEPRLNPDDPATIIYTSGTTGRPKGAVATHRNIISAVINASFNGALSHLRRTGQVPVPDPRASPPAYLFGVPLFHVGGCNAGLVATLASGASLVLMYRWTADRALELIEKLKVTAIGAVPTMIWQLLDHPDFARYDTSSLASAAIGGAAAGRELHERLSARLPGVVAATGYGATETSGGCTYNGGLDYALRPTSVGVPAPIVEVKCIDERGRVVPPGEAGELCFRGGCVLRRYWNDTEATAATFRDGWFHSGDIGLIDDEGRVTILDRAKDMIIRGGENIYTIEVEDALMAHPGVQAAAVFGVPDRVLGEIVAAVVQVRQGTIVSSEELAEFVSARLARFKVPTNLVVTNRELPKNETGKILKRVLREQMFDARQI